MKSVQVKNKNSGYTARYFFGKIEPMIKELKTYNYRDL